MGTRRAFTTSSWALLGCEVGGRLCMGEEGALSRGEPILAGARCEALKPVDGKRRWEGVRPGVASPTIVLQQKPSVLVYTTSCHSSRVLRQGCSSISTRCHKIVGSQRNTGEAYLLASLNSEIAAMLLLSCSSAESTPAVTSSALCTVRL